MQNAVPATVSPDGAAAAAPGSLNRRRAVPRSPHRAPCRLRLVGSPTPGQWTVCGETVNISACGMGVQLGRPLPPGAAVEVVIARQDDEPIHVRGTVVHTRRVLTGTFEVGIRCQNDRDRRLAVSAGLAARCCGPFRRPGRPAEQGADVARRPVRASRR